MKLKHYAVAAAAFFAANKDLDAQAIVPDTVSGLHNLTTITTMKGPDHITTLTIADYKDVGSNWKGDSLVKKLVVDGKQIASYKDSWWHGKSNVTINNDWSMTTYEDFTEINGDTRELQMDIYYQGKLWGTMEHDGANFYATQYDTTKNQIVISKFDTQMQNITMTTLTPTQGKLSIDEDENAKWVVRNDSTSQPFYYSTFKVDAVRALSSGSSWYWDYNPTAGLDLQNLLNASLPLLNLMQSDTVPSGYTTYEYYKNDENTPVKTKSVEKLLRDGGATYFIENNDICTCGLVTLNSKSYKPITIGDENWDTCKKILGKKQPQ